ncbi:MAG: extracellular solute-binding protein [Neobacillus sp.]
MFIPRIAFIFILLFVTTSCDNQSIIKPGEPVQDSVGSEKIKIEVWHTYSEQETKIFENEIIPLFEKEKPNIDVIPVRQSYNEQLMSAIVSRASANKPPDIVRMDIAWIGKFADLELLYPVNKFEDFDKLKNRFYEEPLNATKYQEDYYGLPLNTNTKISIYNRDQLNKFGITKPPETMEELINIVENNQDLTLGLTGVDAWYILPYFYGLGGKITNQHFTKAIGYLDSVESIRAVSKLVELYKNGNINPNLLSGHPNLWEGIRTGEYFMIDEGPWFYSVNSKNEISKINAETVSAPFPTHNGTGSVLGGEHLVISKGTKQLEASWEFLKWMTSEVPQEMLLKTGLLPTNKNVKMDIFLKEFPYYKDYIDSLDQTFLRPSVPEWGKVEEVFNRNLRQIFTERISVEEGLSKAAAEIDLLLGKKKGS